MLITINFIFFILVCLFTFTIPGFFLLRPLKDKLNSWENLVLSTIVGFLFFTLLAYILLSIHLIILLIPAVLILDFWGLKYLKGYKKIFSFPSKDKLIILVIVFSLGILGQLLIIAPSGILLNGDLVFWSSHGHDASWHIALMNEIKNGFPLQNPVFAGEKLINYHFFSDISPAIFNLFFHIPTLDLYFRFFPFIFSLALGSLAFFLGNRIGGNFSSGVWAAFFTYFAGSFGYFVTFAKNRTIGGESLFWASQTQSSTGNLPLIESLVITLSFLLIFQVFKFKNLALFLILSILLGTLSEFKSYAGVVVILSLGLTGIWQAVKERRIWILTSAVIAANVSFVLYFPNSAHISKFLIFEPWWFIRTMIVVPERLNWLDLELRRQTYISEGNIKRVLQIELTGFLIFLFGNLGMRFLGFISLFKFLKSSLKNYFFLEIILICLISFILPLLFLQKGVAGNTIQFMQYFLLIFGILSGITVSKLLEKITNNFVKVFLSVIFIALAIPTQLGLLREFYSRPAFTKIDQLELSALDYLKKETSPKSVILTPPYNKYLRLNLSTPPIWAWSDTAYVSAFSEKMAYFADFEQNDIMGYDINKRLAYQQEVFSQTEPTIVETMLKDKNINYLYFPKLLRPKADLSKTHFTRVFSNSEIEIWKI